VPDDAPNLVPEGFVPDGRLRLGEVFNPRRAADGKPPRFQYAPTGVWRYADADGRTVAYRLRLALRDGGKSYVTATWARHPDGTAEWCAVALPRPRPLYRLPDLAARPGAGVLLAEGEKAAGAAATLFPELVATSPMDGAMSPHLADWTPLQGRHIVVWPDHDAPGRDFAVRVAALAHGAGAASVRVVDVPDGWPRGWDLADPLPEGVGPDALWTMLAEARPWTPPAPEPEPDPEVAGDLARVRDAAERLAALPEAAADVRMKREADGLGVTVRLLRREVRDARVRMREAETAPTAEAEDPRGRVRLHVNPADLPDTAQELAGVLAERRPMLFDRGGPVRLAYDAQRGGLVAEPLGVNGVVLEAHEVARPFERRTRGDALVEVDVTLPERAARLYLDMRGRWGLRPLDGIAAAPLLSADGSMRVADGYDPATRLWCERMPADVAVPEAPTEADALAALARLRRWSRTFAFADAETVMDPDLGVAVVDLRAPPGHDESAALAALLTAVCRPSLWLAPGVMVAAPSYSGAGTGKGLLVRSWCLVAYGAHPRAMTAGATPEEMEKRIAAALVGAEATLFLDNVNATALRSDTLASCITERPAYVRPLGSSTTVPLNPSCFVAVTGNGLRPSEDLARRFVIVELDAKTEDPEARPFRSDHLRGTLSARADLLEAALTVWRWGRQTMLRPGKPLGSFGDWCSWVRDPLLALGCRDPAERIVKAKANDPRRRAVVELFTAWADAHGQAEVTAAGLAESVRAVVDPMGRGRQYLAGKLRGLEGTRAAGYVLVREAPEGRWTADRYRLVPTVDAGDRPSRDPAPGWEAEL
jgi:hypothetical protein